MMNNTHKEKNVGKYHIHNITLHIYIESYTIMKEVKEVNNNHHCNNMMIRCQHSSHEKNILKTRMRGG
jgi:hypothetical protein